MKTKTKINLTMYNLYGTTKGEPTSQTLFTGSKTSFRSLQVRASGVEGQTPLL